MIQSMPKFHLFKAKSKILIAIQTILTALLFNSMTAVAQQDNSLQNEQSLAETNASELGSAVAQDHWTRVEFSGVYADPIVVVEAASINSNNAYIVGIRNIDTRGFEINLKSCSNSNVASIPQNINYSVIDKSLLTLATQSNSQISQHFAWGECDGTSI